MAGAPDFCVFHCMLTALLATPAGLHNCQTCWVHSVRLHDPGQCQPSQSQWGEEKWLLEHFFAEKRNGVYVELGAVDGVRFSNTLALHTCRDWTGVLVEAPPNSQGKISAGLAHSGKSVWTIASNMY